MLSPELEHTITRFLPFFIIIMMFVMVRLVKVFTNHQQKMAEILNRSSTDKSDIAALRREISELRTLVSDHVIANDVARLPGGMPPPVPVVADRLAVDA